MSRVREESRHRHHRHRHAAQHRVARQRIAQRVVEQRVEVGARPLGGDASGACPGRSWPQPCGRLTTPGIISSLISTSASIERPPCADARAAAVGEPEARGVGRVDERGAAERPLREHRQVVHPAVVRAQLAPADDHELGHRPREVGRARATGRRAATAARARSCPTACAAPRARAARAGRGRCRAARPSPSPASGRRDCGRSRRRTGRRAARDRAGARGRCSARAARITTLRRGRRPRAATSSANELVVERLHVGVRALALRDARSGAAGSATPAAGRPAARTPAGCSARGCATTSCGNATS